MDDYISRQAAIEALKKLPLEYANKEQRARTGGIATCKMVIRNIPPADVRPVIRGTNESASGFLCSVCSFGDFGGFHGYRPNFCPNCGAQVK